MTKALVSKQFVKAFGDQARAVAEKSGGSVTFITLPETQGARLTEAERDSIDCAFVDRDIVFDEQLYAAFDDAVSNSNSLKWLHVQSSSAAQHPYAPRVDKKGGIVTSSTGSNAEPVAQTGFTGLLMLARGFPRFIQGQQKHEWRPMRGAELPPDLRGQTVLLIGVGAIGKNIARYAKAFGLKTIGVRRSPATPDDPVDEMYPPSKLNEVLPRADWIVIACPLTKHTRDLVSAESFKHMKKGAHLINIARGEIVNEEALIEALRSGQLAGAALDAHVKEPLPADSPLWDLPNVIVSPHNASASTGNEARCAQMFIANMGLWLKGEPMLNLQDLS